MMLLAQQATLTDEEVVRRVRAGETPLFEVLMRRYNQRVYRVVRAVLRDDAESEDAMQQAYVSAFAHLEQFAGAARFSTWLTRIALNEALSRLKARARFVPVDGKEETMDGLPRVRSPEDAAANRELASVLEQAIAALPEHYRTVFVLREVEELSTAETADCLELTEEAVKVRLHRARGMLRDAIADQVGRTAKQAYAFHLSRCDRVVKAVLARLTIER